MKVSVDTPVLGFEADLTDLCKLAQDLCSAKLDPPAREALKAMLMEADKDFSTVVDVLMPLLTIHSREDLKEKWGRTLADFKDVYYKNWGLLGTSCGITIQHLDRIKKSKSWQSHVPLIRRSYQRLEELGNKWVCNDQMLYERMSKFMESVKAGLEEVDQCASKDKAKAIQRLKKLFHGLEPHLLKIKAGSNQLKLLSARF